MPNDDSDAGLTGERAAWFTTTHWSVVRAAGDRASPQADAALEKLCCTYWYPLYAYIRRRDSTSQRYVTSLQTEVLALSS